VTGASEPLVSAATAATDATVTVAQGAVEVVAPVTEPVVGATVVVLETLSQTAGDVAATFEPTTNVISAAGMDVAAAAGAAAVDVTQPLVESVEPVAAALEEAGTKVLPAVTEIVDAVAGIGSDAVTTPAEQALDAAAAVGTAAGDIATDSLEPLAAASSALAGVGEDVLGAAQDVGTALASGPAFGFGVDDVALPGLIAGSLAVASWGVFTVRSGVATNARLAFPNVRLIPCVAALAVEQTVGAIVAPAAALVGGGGSVGEGLPARAGHHAPTGATAVREGFVRVKEAAAAGGSGVRSALNEVDERTLMMRIGMLLGLAYVAFLTVWFWATRLRWNGNGRAGA
jgi:hypothetical protein